MPTILRKNGFRFCCYASDSHEPIHVHVVKDKGYGKICLEPDIHVNYLIGFKKQEQQKILKIVEANQDYLKAQWHEYFKENK